MKNELKEYHRFLDEAGDTTFYGKGKTNILLNTGVSNSFIIGMLKIKEPIESVRQKVVLLQNEIINNSFYNEVPSIKKKISGTGYFLHAKDDIPEIRKEMYDLIKTIDCSFEAVVGRKIISLYETKHKGKEEYFYADLLSILIENKLTSLNKLVLNVANRGKSTKNHNLELALAKAKQRLKKKSPNKILKTNVVFNVSTPIQEPLLNISDYFCWAIQRVFERGETRYYDYIKNQISLVRDIYDKSSYTSSRNYYKPSNPLTSNNKISPH